LKFAGTGSLQSLQDTVQTSGGNTCLPGEKRERDTGRALLRLGVLLLPKRIRDMFWRGQHTALGDPPSQGGEGFIKIAPSGSTLGGEKKPESAPVQGGKVKGSCRAWKDHKDPTFKVKHEFGMQQKNATYFLDGKAGKGENQGRAESPVQKRRTRDRKFDTQQTL